uniref:Uncharacterized protein n=1 Tax=Triticum urartu TaxID=4572 RepID=A0A8R7TBN5_TRIUA
MVIQGEEEQAKVAEIVTSSNDMEHIEVALLDGLVGEVPPFVSSSVTLASGGTTNMMSFGSEEPLGDIGAPSTTLLDEFLSSFSCAAPRSLLEEPIHVQIDGASTCSERRSGRLDKKNRNCDIPAAKRAEYRLVEAYGELPKGMTSKKGSEEYVQEKMNSYLRMYKKTAYADGDPGNSCIGGGQWLISFFKRLGASSHLVAGMFLRLQCLSWVGMLC